MPRKSIVLGMFLVLGASARGEKPLSVLAYNIFFRPHFVGLFDQKADRYPTVLAAAAAYDVVGFSEAFVEHYRQRLRRDLKASHPHVVEPPRDGLREDAGIYLMSRYPIRFHHTHVFRNASGSDALAAKGVIYARLDLGEGQAVDIALTHLQSGEKHYKARLRQVHEVREFVRRWESPSVPLLILGDLNVIGDVTEEYRRMLMILGRPWDVYRGLNADGGFTWDGVANPLAGNGERQRIDYVLCRHCAGREGWFQGSRVRPFALKSPIGKAKFGSDHYAVEARLVVPHKGSGSPPGGSAISSPRL